jgi:transglutaminase-like putative cysteine protease
VISTLLIDIEGTLVERGRAVPGAAHALAELSRRRLAVRLVTNISSRPAEAMASELVALGFDGVQTAHVYTAADAARRLLVKEQASFSDLLFPDGVARLFSAFLERGWGSCRDFAVLFAEAVRSLGFGARIVSGYLFNPHANAVGSSGSGSTHAWTEVYVPGAGWITFDPTNRSVGGFNLIPVAVARDIAQVVPVAGSFAGQSDTFIAMTVDVRVAASRR